MTWSWLSAVLLKAHQAIEVPAAPFCSHKLPWDECQEYLPFEKKALARFLDELETSSKPSTSAFKGRGIVMSGGKQHVLQALANLDVLRSHHKSYLPVEFWHAFELEDAHCEALAASGASCRQLQVPGVYKEYATIVPAVMSSSFQDVLWMDTDVTPLVAPEVLFESELYQQTGALFWPDHWSQDCYPFGESSWQNHVAWQLLELKYNISDNSYRQEHETGHFLINKQRHWRSICLAHYLASRDFFTQVLVGCKDAFRLAFLKLNMSNWLSPVRPGLVGTFMKTGLFYPAAMVQFWPSTEPLGDGRYHSKLTGRHIPLYIHQKKLPGFMWTDFLTFQQPMGECIRYNLQPLDVGQDTDLWDLANSDPEVAQKVFQAEAVWEQSFAANLAKLKNHPGLSNHSKEHLTFKMNPFQSHQWDKVTQSCRCDFGNNLWLHLLTFLIPEQREAGMAFKEGYCALILLRNLDSSSCPVGFATLAFLCSGLLENPSHRQRARDLVQDLLPDLETCLPQSFWPISVNHLELLDRDEDPGSMLAFDADRVSQLSEPLQRCLPLKFPDCWNPRNVLTARGLVNTNQQPVKNACVFCCGTGNSLDCFDETYTEDLCCNQLNRTREAP